MITSHCAGTLDDNADANNVVVPDVLPVLRPEIDERFLALSFEWHEPVLSGVKTLEIRNRALPPGRWFFGIQGILYGYMDLGEGFLIKDDKTWRSLIPQHQVDQPTRMYTRSPTWAHPIKSASRIVQVRYHIRVGAIGTKIFQPVAGDAGRMDSK